MEYLDSKCEKILKAIIKIDRVSYQGVHYRSTIELINVMTNGKFIDNSENLQILTYLAQKEYISYQVDVNGFQFYMPLVKGKTYFQTKWRSILFGAFRWVEILLGGAGGVIIGYLLSKK